MSKHPKTFTAKVAYGQLFGTIFVTRYLITLPSAPPNATYRMVFMLDDLFFAKIYKLQNKSKNINENF